MRRGPRLHYTQLVLSVGFGVNAEKPSERIGGDKGKEKSDSEVNVLDWSNCSLLAFIGLFYVGSPS